jgi:hypothetical protein
MIKVETSQGEIIIDVPEKYSKVGIKISVGADSAILSYMLALYKRDVRDIDLIPFTAINAAKPYQHIFAHRVIGFIEKQVGVQFYIHQIKPELVNPDTYAEELTEYTRLLRNNGIIQTHFTGITENPDADVKLVLDNGWDGMADREKSLGIKPIKRKNSYVPFANVNKKAIAELYNYYGLTDTLFPITRSCESRKTHFTQPHCGKCWWCVERKWAFGRLD